MESKGNFDHLFVAAVMQSIDRATTEDKLREIANRLKHETMGEREKRVLRPYWKARLDTIREEYSSVLPDQEGA